LSAWIRSLLLPVLIFIRGQILLTPGSRAIPVADVEAHKPA
jgi:hypothetical protein